MKPFQIAVFALAVSACSNDKPPSDPSSASQATITKVQTDDSTSPYQATTTTDSSATQGSDATRNDAARNDDTRDDTARNDAWRAQTPDSTAPSASTSNVVGTDSTRKTGAEPSANPSTPSPQAARSTPPDNTRVNQRDRSDAAPTPGDQSNSQSDTKITQLIRKAVMGDKTLSFTAKNAKIITQDGKVTLRGPVNTAAERASIERAAKGVAGVTSVDNQLEVKP